jgi:hypothetical protein
MGIIPFWVKAVAVAIMLSAIAGGLTWLHHSIYHGGYVAGQAERTAHYEPILVQAARDKEDADRRADKAEQAAKDINAKLETDHAQHQKELVDRAAGADARIAQLLRQRAAASATLCHQPLSTVPGGWTVIVGPSAGDASDNRLASRVSGVGKQCEHDAAEVAEWHTWYSRQRAAYTEALKVPAR